jgi:hypothetical protein
MAEVPLPEPKAVRTVRIELPDLDDGEGMHPLDPVAMMRANRKSVQIQALIGACEAFFFFFFFFFYIYIFLVFTLVVFGFSGGFDFR